MLNKLETKVLYLALQKYLIDILLLFILSQMSELLLNGIMIVQVTHYAITMKLESIRGWNLLKMRLVSLIY